MEDWKKSEKTFSLACNLERASGTMQNTCVKIEHLFVLSWKLQIFHLFYTLWIQ